MFNLGERVKHLDTGNIGIVIGYGQRIVNNQCLETVKVRLLNSTTSQKITIKDLNCRWFPCPEDYRTLYPNPTSRHLLVKPIKRYDLAKSA